MEAGSEREAQTHEGEPSRRRALRLILGGAMVALGLPERASAGGDLAGAGADVLVAELKDLPPGAVRPAEFHGMPVLVLNVEGTVEVLSAICTHEGCEVAWDPERKLLQCPCHGGQYDRHGKVLQGPPPAPLVQLPVEVRQGKVYVVE